MPGLFKTPREHSRNRPEAPRPAAIAGLASPAGRRKARWHAALVDHGILRRLWSNMHDLGGGAWRSNQPGPERFARLERMGIRTVINLRGASDAPVHLLEREACARHGMRLIDHRIGAYGLSPARAYLELLELFDTVERPFVMHCKSGADRSGLASAMYLIDQRGVPVEQARRQLALRYLHRRSGKAGVLDYLLDSFAADIRARPMDLREWLRTRYDREALGAAYRARRARRSKGARK